MTILIVEDCLKWGHYLRIASISKRAGDCFDSDRKENVISQRLRIKSKEDQRPRRVNDSRRRGISYTNSANIK